MTLVDTSRQIVTWTAIAILAMFYFITLPFFKEMLTLISPGWSHSEGLSERWDKDVLQVRRHWTHSQGLPEQGVKR